MELSLMESKLLWPVLNPGATICVGLNYRTHREEMGIDRPAYPTLLGKLARSLTDPFADIALPAVCEKIDIDMLGSIRNTFRTEPVG
jgi:acylpyruvate hydrolase